MATLEKSMLNSTVALQSGIFWDLISNQITATNEFGNQGCFVFNDGGSDVGLYGSLLIPTIYSSTPVVVISGILDGAPGAAETLGFAIQGLSRADNEAGDTAYSTEDAASATIGSSGTNHSDEDHYVETISLSNVVPTAGEMLYYYFFLDTSGTTYGGNFLLTGLDFRFSN